MIIFDLLHYDFMQRALLGGLLIGISTGLIGVFLVLKRLSLLGDSFAHASFGGVALGFFLNINPILTAILFVTLASFGIDKLINKLKLYGESAIALILSFGMSFALILIGLSNSLNSNIFSYLFGSILTISKFDLLLMVLLLFSILIFYYFQYKNLVFSSFNRDIAIVRNKNIEYVDKIFIILCGLTIVISIRAVGILLISALLVIPVLIALSISKSFKQTLIYSILFSILGIYIGIFTSYYFDIPAGGTIVMSLIFIFLSVIIFKNLFKILKNYN